MTRARPPLGPGRLLVFGYGLFVVATGSRALVQLATHPGRAPLAYGLSAAAAGIYLAGLVLLGRFERHRRGWLTARALCLIELAGVVAVGSVSLLWPSSFPEPTVWSAYGSGYGFVPVVLPLLALWWLTTSEHRFGHAVPQKGDDERVERVRTFDREPVTARKDG
jgi:hypothetical protein